MATARGYLQDVQKFISSQYWHSGFRITAGVMVPLVVFIVFRHLQIAIPFLWGALFVSLTDTPGPIHHRRNGMIAGIVLNTLVVLLTAITKEYQVLLLGQIILFGFLLSMAGVYGTRAGAVGTLALVVMLLNLLSIHPDYNTLQGSLFIAAGGCWYMMFSLLLYRIRPYRPVEQALGEYLIAISDYIRARAAFYKEGANLTQCFDRMMKQQGVVRNIQNQTEEILFKTRRFVADSSPKSRSLMMIYLDSLDLLEQTMYSYQGYEDLHNRLDSTGLLSRYYGLIHQLAAGIEYVGITVQMGRPVTRDVDLTERISGLRQRTDEQLAAADEEAKIQVQALHKILNNVEEISNRANRIILYTRTEASGNVTFEMAQKVSRLAVAQPVTWRALRGNLTFRSANFRHAIRLTTAMLIGYLVSIAFSLSHSYWVLLTIVTILRPAYALSRKRNIQRVSGTLVGIALVSLLLLFISNNTVLLVILVLCMLMGYSLLRVQYFTFVVFLTIFVVITLYFFNPHGFQDLIIERLLDTVVASVIAFVAARFFFPQWGHEEVDRSMQRMLEANRQYFAQAWIAVRDNQVRTAAYALARQDAIVSLTNLSDIFQRILSEPGESAQATPLHQFVIANHMLTGHIAALADEELPGDQAENPELESMSRAITTELQCAEDNLRHIQARTDLNPLIEAPLANQSLSHLSMIFSLAREIRKISDRLSRRAN
jgi:uncharacterized membrane protein YccC